MKKAKSGNRNSGAKRKTPPKSVEEYLRQQLDQDARDDPVCGAADGNGDDKLSDSGIQNR
jgi:hypothetical protein